jgi:hypothetical protein
MVRSPLGVWKVTFAKLKDLDPALGYTFMDGDLQLWGNNWMVLRDQRGKAIEGRYLHPKVAISVGSMFEFPQHLVRIFGVLSDLGQVRDPLPPCLIEMDPGR